MDSFSIMRFPFSVIFNRRLRAPVTADNQKAILHYIVNSITKDKAENVIVMENTVTYKGSSSRWRGSLFKSVDDGTFTLIDQNGTWCITYRINMLKLFVTTAIMSIMLGLFMATNGGPKWLALPAFLWLCGGNWVTIVIRHGMAATEIAEGIDELICGKPEPQPGPDKMTGELKSWF